MSSHRRRHRRASDTPPFTAIESVGCPRRATTVPPSRHLGVARSGIPVRRVDGRNRHRPSDVVNVAVAIYGHVIVTQERRERGPGSVVQVADSAYPEEEVGMGEAMRYRMCDKYRICCIAYDIALIAFIAFIPLIA